MSTPTPERDPLERLRAGDESAFEAIFRTEFPRLVAAATYLLRDQARAEDLAQDVLLELWRHRARLEPGTSIPAYLHRSVRNRALNLFRHERVVQRSVPLLDTGGPPPAADRPLLEREMEAALQAGVARLPARCREVFELSRVHQLRYAEIADAMGISIKTVEAQMGKAMRLLRESLRDWLPAE